jgi:sulfate/thiosulfate transport system ATP-binding protein
VAQSRNRQPGTNPHDHDDVANAKPVVDLAAIRTARGHTVPSGVAIPSDKIDASIEPDLAKSRSHPMPETSQDPHAETQRADPKNESVSIRVEGITRNFGETIALGGVDLNIAGGELIALLGPSGSGKTTLLRIIAGLDQPGSGRIFFGNQDASQQSVQERKIGFVFQHYALFRHMRVFENIAFGLKVRPRGLRPALADIKARVTKLLELVQLPNIGQRYPSQLSGGQRQRVALARALAIEPQVLLLDEPFGALDAKVRRDLRRWLREIHDKTGHTTVFVTHDQEEALELADRVVVMNKGRIEQVGSPDEIYDHPATPFVFGFIGESTALPVDIIEGAIHFNGKPTGLSTSDAVAGRNISGAASIFVRPDHVTIVPEAEAAFTGIITASRRHASHRRLDIAVGSTGHRFEIDVDPYHPPAVGQTIGLMPQRFALYDAKDVARLHDIGEVDGSGI